MGKASKKVKRQIQKKNDEQRMQLCKPREDELITAFEEEEYAQVLEILADLIKAKDIKPDLLYKGAYSYFMLGDYDRAAQWVNNTLNYNPQHVEARILLARLCFMQNRHEEGLAIYEFLVTNYGQTMTEEEKEQIRDSSEYYGRYQREVLQAKCPRLTKFLKLEEKVQPDNAKPVMTSENKGNSASTLAILQRLKAKMQTVQMKEEITKGTAEAKAETATVSRKKTAEVTENITEKIAEINSQKCSLREKVQLFNKFAAAQYVESDYRGAEAYLKEALQMDMGDPQSIRNMAMVQSALGERAKAQALAANLPEVDFVLLHLLK